MRFPLYAGGGANEIGPHEQDGLCSGGGNLNYMSILENYNFEMKLLVDTYVGDQRLTTWSRSYEGCGWSWGRLYRLRHDSGKRTTCREAWGIGESHRDEDYEHKHYYAATFRGRRGLDAFYKVYI